MTLHAATQPARMNPPIARTTLTSKPTILIVDDELSVLMSLQRHLRDEFHVETALSAAQALEIMLSKGPFSVIISDMKMPHVDGGSFLKYVKTLLPATTRVMLTGNNDTETAVQAINKGHVFRFLQKPMPIDKMRQVIREGVAEYKKNTEHMKMAQGLLSTFQNDFSSPLRQILGFANFIAQDKHSPEAIQSYARYIEQSGSALSRMTDNLLAFISLTEGTRKFMPKLVRVREIVLVLREKYQASLDEKSIALQVSIEKGLAELRIDEELFSLAVSALLSNAIKHSQPCSQIDLKFSWSRNTPSVPMVEIVDMGEGFSQERLDELLQPFTQDESKSQHAGIGIGLPLARAVAEFHEGRLTINSEPGHGTHARIYLSEKAVPMNKNIWALQNTRHRAGNATSASSKQRGRTK